MPTTRIDPKPVRCGIIGGTGLVFHERDGINDVKMSLKICPCLFTMTRIIVYSQNESRDTSDFESSAGDGAGRALVDHGHVDAARSLATAESFEARAQIGALLTFVLDVDNCYKGLERTYCRKKES